MASTAMLLWMARPLFTGALPLTKDLLELHYPLRDFYAKALASGQRFDWMPSLFGGFYVVGEGQLGAYHPLHWLLYRFVALDTAFVIEMVIAYPFMFVGSWLLMRHWCRSEYALCGAMLFTFGAFNLTHGPHINVVGIVSHLPWLLWAIHGLFAATDLQRRLRDLAVIALLTGSQLMLGFPQAFWLSGLVEAAYTILLVVTASRRVGPLVAAITGKVLGIVIGAVQLVPTMYALPGSTRAIYDQSFSMSYSLSPAHLLQLINPYGIWGRVTRWTALPFAGDELAAYGGAVTLILVSWWLAVYARRRANGIDTTADRFAMCALAFAVLGMLLALGSYGGLYYVQTSLPFVRLFRVPARYVLFTQLALAAVAAIALAQLAQWRAAAQRGDWGTLWAPWALALASVFSSFWLGWLFADRLAESTQGMLALTLGPMLFIAAAGLLTLATHGVRFTVAGLVLLAACDQALYGLGGTSTWSDFLKSERLREGNELLPPATGRLLPDDYYDLYSAAGYRIVNGYVGLTPARTLDYRTLPALRVAQVEFVGAEVQQEIQIPGAVKWSGEWYRIPAPLPRARLVSHSVVSEQAAFDLERIDVERTVLATRELYLEPGAAGTARIIDDDPGDIRVETVSSGRQLLVVSESFDDGWIATVDGKPVPVERVNGDFLGCVVESGTHNVLLEFRPRHLAVGKAISLTGIFVVLILVGLSASGWSGWPPQQVAL